MKRRLHVKAEHQLREEIEAEVKSKYIERINYLIGANDELMQTLEKYEKQERQYNGDNVYDEFWMWALLEVVQWKKQKILLKKMLRYSQTKSGVPIYALSS